MKIIPRIELSGTQTAQTIITALLKNRKIADVETFLNPPHPRTISLQDFGYTTEIDHVLEMLKEIKSKDQVVVVYTDYDADGITGGAILWETLHLLGFNAFPYVPHRQHEGYGFSVKGIDNVKAQYNPALIFSVDHGIAAVDQIAYAQSIGIPIVVTDHHHKQTRIPEAAEEIFHIPDLSGSGVAYFFAKELYLRLKQDTKHFPLSQAVVNRLDNYFETDYLALASIGTVADLVPLTDFSRSVVTYGLQAFSRINRKGIKSILKEAKIEEGSVISPYEIGFVIAPRINAVGRLEHAIDALRLLCTTSEERAEKLAGKIGVMNTNRQELVKTSVKEALAQVEALRIQGELPPLIILHSKNWHEGIIGLIASKIVEQFYRPVIIMAEVDGYLKGSARSIASFHITNFFGELKEYFLNYGGHGQAAGFSIETSKLEEFKEIAVTKASKMISEEDLKRVKEVDLNVPLGEMTIAIAREIERLHPFGIGNPHPSFMSEVELVSASIFGKHNNHLKIIVKDSSGSGMPLEMVQFSGAQRFHSLVRGQKLTIAYQLDINRWKGNETLRGRLLCFDGDELADDQVTP